MNAAVEKQGKIVAMTNETTVRPTGDGTLGRKPDRQPSWLRAWLARALTLALLSGVCGTLHAETAPTDSPPVIDLPDPLTPDAITALVSGLSDSEVRGLLLEQLGAVATTAKPDGADPAPSFAQMITGVTRATYARVRDVVRATPATLAAQAEVVAVYVARSGWGGMIRFLGALMAAGLAGVAARPLLLSLIARWRGRPETVQSDAGPATLARLGRDLLGHAAAFLAMLVMIRLMLDGADAVIGQAIAFWLILIPRLVAVGLQTVLRPEHPALRLVVLDDQSAAYLYRSLLGLLLLVCAAFTLMMFNAAVAEPGDMTPDTDLGKTAFWVNLAVFLWLGIIAVRARAGLSSIIRGRTETLTAFERWLAAAYPWFAVAAIALTWAASVVMAAYGPGQPHRGLHLLSLLILLVVPLLDTAIRSMVHHLALPMQGDGEVAEVAYAASLRSYKRMARVVVFGIVIAISTNLWNVSLVNVASAGLGAQVAAHVIRATLICLVGYLIWEVIRLVINRKLARERTEARVAIAQDDVEGQGNEPVSSRLATVLPPISWTLQAVVITMTALTALGNIGIDITPLLAGAGVAGIAIGFGAQKLVSDIVSGIFFLFDDAFRLNEYIDAGGTLGTVEKISLRSIRLRDDNGPLYCIPYSEVSRVTNFGRDWGIMKLKFTVPFDTDPEKVRRIFKRIGQEMLQNPELASSFIEPFKSQGVNAFNDTGMVVRGKFKFKPGTQFAIRKEIYHRVQQEFATAGIEFARKEVRVKISGGEGLTPKQSTAAAAGAVEAAGERRTIG